ncbi:allophanate hydrolase subunit 1 [Pseudoclavibacter chungangensis]|uniref:Allophanate hydrolase subunit 1 n=1 Tax=Pseudoclavibacter chungangensis TaxID=587635 RepID=A0A7J5BQQ2_9MICO|nr:carboxyltransferase domain-containing protein [Pseudoclavibacter chungangensis]KAB1656329.1 allophanate hydrolase subunit 1 [Pseudoclavibacter chungangensis]NYJ67096.1 KipI family sensor histidine kinase inhibitor [Pseudoclavibacter chungangensis]
MSAVDPAHVRIAGSGAAAIRVSSDSGDRERDWRTVHLLADALARSGTSGLIGCVPTYESVLVEYDPFAITAAELTGTIESTLAGLDADRPLHDHPRHFVVPVRYGGELGPDLDRVAHLTGLAAEDVIRLHLEPLYTVRCLGAPGGSPMLDGPAFPVPVPRLASPRTSVPAGIVSVAGRQATVAPATAPGGWSGIGSTPLRILDLTREPLVPYRPGDTIRFERIDDERFEALRGHPLEAVAA